MEELDLLKKQWQKPDAFQQLSEADLYEMIHKKSSSIVKLILIISFLEFIFWIILSLLIDTSESFKNEPELIYLDIIEYLSYGVVLVFMYLLFKNYKKISVTQTTKQLMIDILDAKKIVQYYVWYNLIIIALGLSFGVIYAFFTNPEMQLMNGLATTNNNLLIGSIFAMAVVLIILFGLFWLFYRLLYGILLKKLYANYNELKKIDL